MGELVIAVNFTFPDEDPTAEPVIETASTMSNTVETDVDTVSWVVTANIDNTDGLKIDGIEFFTDSGKTTAARPACMNLPGAASGNGWSISLNDSDDAGETLYYNIAWEDNDWPNERTDPTLEIKPRKKAPPEREAGAGA